MSNPTGEDERRIWQGSILASWYETACAEKTVSPAAMDPVCVLIGWAEYTLDILAAEEPVLIGLNDATQRLSSVYRS